MAETKKHKILIVDDIPQNIQVLGNALKNEAYLLAYAQGGEEAISIAGKSTFDLILLDVLMPDINGFEVCRQLRNNPKTANVPIIFLTAKTNEESIAEGFESGGQDYITKPFKALELQIRVQTQLDLREKQQQLASMNKTLEKKVQERTVQLQKANDELQTANFKLSKLDNAKNDFLLLINHELRTPLNAIIGFTQILENNLKTTKYANFIKIITRSTDKLYRLSEIALLITSLRAESYEINKENFSIKQLIDYLIEQYSAQIENKDIAIITDIIPEDFEIQIDRRLLYTCLSNIFNNALKYSPENMPVEIKVTHRNNSIHISISDNGKGFSEDLINSGFDLFTIENARHHSEGFGLGLATVKVITEALDGEFNISNRKEGGAQVELIFHNIVPEKNRITKPKQT